MPEVLTPPTRNKKSTSFFQSLDFIKKLGIIQTLSLRSLEASSKESLLKIKKLRFQGQTNIAKKLMFQSLNFLFNNFLFVVWGVEFWYRSRV